MSFVERLTFRGKLTLVILATSGLALALAAIGIIGHGVLTARDDVESQLRVAAQHLGSSASAALQFEDSVNATRYLKSFEFSPHVRAAALFLSSDGSLLGEFHRESERFEIPPFSATFMVDFSREAISVQEPVYQGADLLGYVYVQRDLADIHAEIFANVVLVLVVLVISFLVALIFSARLKRILTGPVGELVRAADRVSNQKDYSVRARKISHDELGQLTDAFNMMLSDIEGRDEALKASEGWFRGIIENTSEIIFVLLRGGECVYANPSIKVSLGIAAESVIDQVLSDVIHRSDKKRFDDCVARSMRTPEKPSTLSDFRFVCGDGRIVYADATFTCMLGVIGIDGIVVHCRETTERVESAAERETLIQELEAKNAELERFTYTVSHDLKSPLVTINGFAGLLEKDLKAERMDRVQEDLERIRTASETMQRLLNELLDLSRVGRIMNDPVDVSLVELSERAVAQLGGAIREREVEVIVQADMPHVSGDPVRLLEVMQNLIDNGIKFMGDRVDPKIEIGAEIKNGTVWCFVRDNGMGIHPDYHEKIFGLFDRLDAASEGTGIGLSLVKRIIEVHEGRIWVESEGEDCGTVFRFILPEAKKVASHV